MEGMIEHHTHYKEIHGYDKTVWMTRSDHIKLHKRLRKEGKCNIPYGELADISAKAHSRTDKVKNGKKAYAREYQARKQIERAYIQGNEYRYMYGLDYQEDHFLKPLL